jgi:hypothetical protein
MHRKIFHNHYQCLGHSIHGDARVPTYHGDPMKGWRIWVIPPSMPISEPSWEFRVNPCSKAVYVGTHENGVHELTCPGHLVNLEEIEATRTD